MPELTPTLATAYLYENGSVIVNTTRLPRGTAHERVPCLILPAPRPIAECPEEWQDGRQVSLYFESVEAWIPGEWNADALASEGGYWASVDDADRALVKDYGSPTHIMLPPPSPEEVKHA